tara:strand:+ start:4068 stop:5114 length:1047 start_codon:yes stop_codon:yes gene_type:complete
MPGRDIDRAMTRRRERGAIRFRPMIALNVLALGLLTVAVITFGTSKENGTRVRNSFLVQTAGEQLLSLPPAALPADFQRERLPAPEYLVVKVDELIPPHTRGEIPEFEQSLILARHLIANKGKGKAIQGSVQEAYRLIRDQGRGYCADYSQVFTALALAAGIPVREWGLGFDGFGRGHAFNDVYDTRLQQWVFIDSYHSLFVIDPASGRPLSTLEFQRRLLDDGNMQTYRFVPIVAEKYRFHTAAEANDYYAKTAANFYLFWGNDVFSYDDDPVVRLLAPLSRPLEVLGAIASGAQPGIRVLELPGNARYIARLETIRQALVTALIVALALLITLGLQLMRLMRRRQA